ncbi:MAG: hypothetical protein M5U34_27475 [Chloroflexi bacterium]|nr:hypothetical protein [Chloroflexota bacterium]
MFDEGAEALKMATWDMFEWLRKLHEDGQLKTDFVNMEMVLPYHAPCQYRAHRVGRPAFELLSIIPGIDARKARLAAAALPEPMAIKKRNIKSPMDVGQELFDFVHDQGDEATMTACDSETCRWQMEYGTDLPSRHPIEILAAAYGLYDSENRQLTNE